MTVRVPSWTIMLRNGWRPPTAACLCAKSRTLVPASVEQFHIVASTTVCAAWLQPARASRSAAVLRPAREAGRCACGRAWISPQQVAQPEWRLAAGGGRRAPAAAAATPLLAAWHIPWQADGGPVSISTYMQAWSRAQMQPGRLISEDGSLQGVVRRQPVAHVPFAAGPHAH